MHKIRFFYYKKQQIIKQERGLAIYKVIILDTDTHHEISHVVRCHGGTDFWIIMCFASDCMVMTKSGLKRARPGDCFIKSPDFIEYHYTPKDCSDGFINDWIHLSSENLWEDMQELQLPVNELIHTGQPLLLRSSLSKIIQEKKWRASLLGEKMQQPYRRFADPFGKSFSRNAKYRYQAIRGITAGTSQLHAGTPGRRMECRSNGGGSRLEQQPVFCFV